MSYATTKIPKTLADEIDKLVDAQVKGYRTRMEFVIDAVRGKLKEFERELEESRFEHFNVIEDASAVTIIDHKLGDKWVNVYFREKKPYCDYCEEVDCDHILFALTLPEIREALQKTIINGFI